MNKLLVTSLIPFGETSLLLQVYVLVIKWSCYKVKEKIRAVKKNRFSLTCDSDQPRVHALPEYLLIVGLPSFIIALAPFGR